MKKHFFVVALFLTLLFAGKTLSAQTVYITDTGKKYHAKNCSVAKTGKRGISLKDAKKEGYEPCKVCKAEAIQEAVEKPKPQKNPKEKNTESAK